MSETYILAARLPLKKKAVTAWLRSPLVAWPGRPERLRGSTYTMRTVRHGFAEAADDVVQHSGGLVAAWSGDSRAFLIYQVLIGWQPVAVARTLDAIAAAADHLQRKRPTHALLLAETGARLWVDGVLSTIRLGPGAAEVVAGNVDLAAVIADLRPAEAAWDRALALGPVEALHHPGVLQPAIRQLARSPVLKKRKRVVPQFEDAAGWLAGIRSVRVGDDLTFGGFEKEIPGWADQVERFGPAVVDDLLMLLSEPAWEPGVVAFWALNALARATEDPEPYLRAIAAWGRWPSAYQGWARGEVTNAGVEARKEHREALRGTGFERRGITSLSRELAQVDGD